MKILAIDTSSNVASVALMSNEKLIAEYTINNKRTHSQKLMPLIDQMLKDCENTIKDIDIIAVAIGPGSFTGLRIGVATAKALAYSMKIKVVGVSTLKALAYNCYHSEDIICPILDARRNQVYTALYKRIDDDFEAILEPKATSVDDLIDKIQKNEGNVILVGDGAEKFEKMMKEKIGSRLSIAKNPYKMPKASSLAQIVLMHHSQYVDQNFYKILPQYLRKSEAEIQYELKIKGENLNG